MRMRWPFGHRQISRHRGVFTVVAAAFVSLGLRAEEGRFHDYAVGARAMGLGGAFTAIADDPSGVFYNPAGIVDVGRARLSLTTSLYGLEFNGATPVEGVAQRLGAGLSAADLIIVPSSTGAAVGLGRPLPGGQRRHAVAFGTLVPSYTSRLVETELEAVSSGQKTRFRSQLTDRTLHGGVAYGYRPSQWLRVGIAMHYVLRTVDAQDDLATPWGPGVVDSYFMTNSRLRATQHSARVALGLKGRPGPRWSLGILLVPPSLGLWRTVDFEALTVDARTPSQASQTRASAEISTADTTSHLPAMARLGAAFTEPGDYTLSFDLIGYAPSSYTLLEFDEVVGDRADFERIPIPLRVDRGGLVNGAVGMEKLLSTDVSVSFGLFTNFSSAERLALKDNGLLLGDSPRLSNVHMVGGSLAIGLFQEHSLHRIGITGSTGFGNVVLPSAPDPDTPGAPPLRAVSAAQSFLYIFWSSSFRYGEGRSSRDLRL
ncbi:MAG: hypothetical protein ACO3JL_16040 [Myxococcota bacterium]